jgi:hypothetical protein
MMVVICWLLTVVICWGSDASSAAVVASAGLADAPRVVLAGVGDTAADDDCTGWHGDRAVTPCCSICLSVDAVMCCCQQLWQPAEHMIVSAGFGPSCKCSKCCKCSHCYLGSWVLAATGLCGRYAT